MTFTMRFPRDVPTLTDGVVTLRAHTADDVEALYEQAADSLMLRWTTVPDPSTLETARQFACEIIPDGWRADREWAFAVDAPDEGGGPRFVGTVSLRNEGEGRAEIAYGAHPWSRGRGYVVRALELLLDWGFQERGLRTVIWRAHKGNWASRKVAWRVGFSFDGTLRQWLPQRGALHDAWVGTLTADDERRPRTRWLDLPRIHGDGLVLREPRDEDAPRIVEGCSEERTSYWLTHMPSPYTLVDAQRWLEQQRELRATGNGLSWAVADPESDEALGVVTVFDISDVRDAEIGYWTHPDARGRGLMTRACGLAVRHCFVPAEDGGLGLRRLRALAAEGNSASEHVLKATGFVETGRLRKEHRMRDGSHIDMVYFDLLASEYPGA